MSLQRIQSVPSLLVQAQRLPIAYTGAQARHTKTEALGSSRQRTDTSPRVSPLWNVQATGLSSGSPDRAVEAELHLAIFADSERC